jgi:hypothetical protein
LLAKDYRGPDNGQGMFSIRSKPGPVFFFRQPFGAPVVVKVIDGTGFISSDRRKSIDRQLRCAPPQQNML